MMPLELLPGDCYEHFFEGAPCCPRCLAVTEPEWVSPTFALKRDRADAVYTRDGALVVTARFRDHHPDDAGVRYRSLPADTEHYRLMVDQVVQVELSRTSGDADRCELCGRAARYGAPTRLLSEDSLPDGFSRSDVEYGGLGGFPRLQLPAIFVDPDTALRLRRLKRCRTRPIRT